MSTCVHALTNKSSASAKIGDRVEITVNSENTVKKEGTVFI